jgi:hypothetical protein
MTERQQQIAAFTRAARTFNHIAIERKRWAAQAEQEGRTDLARKWGQQAQFQRINAVWHLHYAQDLQDGIR